MIWFDVAVALLLTLRTALAEPMQQRLLEPATDSSLLVANEDEEGFWVAEGEAGEPTPLFEIALRDTSASAIHIFNT